MVYIGWDGQEYEDLEADNARRARFEEWKEVEGMKREAEELGLKCAELEVEVTGEGDAITVSLVDKVACSIATSTRVFFGPSAVPVAYDFIGKVMNFFADGYMPGSIRRQSRQVIAIMKLEASAQIAVVAADFFFPSDALTICHLFSDIQDMMGEYQCVSVIMKGRRE